MKNLLLLEADAGGAFVEIQGPGPVDIPGIFKRMVDRQGRAMPETIYQYSNSLFYFSLGGFAERRLISLAIS